MTDLYAECHEVGGMTAHYRLHDPRRLAFVAARYKFVARMLEGQRDVLEVGCADGYFSPIVRQHVKQLTAIDIDAKSIEQAQRANSPDWPIKFKCRDLMKYRGHHGSAYCLDVLEHIERKREEAFLLALHDATDSHEPYRGDPNSLCIIGMPSLESQKYASPLSLKGHVNCKTGPELKKTLSKHWQWVFIFSMSDEVVHTGYQPMAQYLLALCVG